MRRIHSFPRVIFCGLSKAHVEAATVLIELTPASSNTRLSAAIA
jgi:hypothetical protein